MIEGFEIVMGGQPFTVPPLSLKGLKKVLSLMQKLAGASMEEQLDITLQALHTALLRNYPELTVDQIEDLVAGQEWSALPTAMTKLLGMSGLVASGEVGGGSQSIGDGSTDASPLQPDTAEAK